MSYPFVQKTAEPRRMVCCFIEEAVSGYVFFRFLDGKFQIPLVNLHDGADAKEEICQCLTEKFGVTIINTLVFDGSVTLSGPILGGEIVIEVYRLPMEKIPIIKGGQYAVVDMGNTYALELSTVVLSLTTVVQGRKEQK